MSTAATRRGYGKRRSHGYLEPLDERGMPPYRLPTRDEMRAWARAHGYPTWPDTSPTYAYLTDDDRRAVTAMIQFHDHLSRAEQARLAGRRDAAAYYARMAASSRAAYANSRRRLEPQVTTAPRLQLNPQPLQVVARREFATEAELADRYRCRAWTKQGTRCTRIQTADGDYCRQHSGANP